MMLGASSRLRSQFSLRHSSLNFRLAAIGPTNIILPWSTQDSRRQEAESLLGHQSSNEIQGAEVIEEGLSIVGRLLGVKPHELIVGCYEFLLRAFNQ